MGKFVILSLFALAVFASGAQIPVSVDVVQKPDQYHVVIDSGDNTHHLQLTPPDNSVFGHDFEYIVTDVDEDGNQIFNVIKPSQEELEDAEKHIYVDPNTNSVVRLKPNNNGHEVHGVIDGHTLSHENGQHFLTERNPQDASASDYVDTNRTITHNLIQSRAVTIVTAEVAVVFDNENYKTFNGNQTAMLQYLGLYFHCINNRYANNVDPKITFQISGLTAMASTTAQPFITSSVTPGSTYDIDKMLDSFAVWGKSNAASLPKHDLLSLFTAVHLQNKDSSGAYKDGIAGLAYVRAACYSTSTKDLSTAVIAEAGGAYLGLVTAAHELAHNLGSPHDGQTTTDAYNTGGCPWSEGYIMSYEGHGTLAKFSFSSCSQQQMKNYITSSGGTCLLTQQSQSTWTALPKQNAGDYMNMTVQCQKSLNKAKAYVDTTKSADDLCRNIVCKYPDDTNPGTIWTSTRNAAALDSSPCGESGSCNNGYCVYVANMTTQCKSSISQPTAVVDDSKTPDSLCSNLVCKYPNAAVANSWYVTTTNKAPLDYTPCGKGGRCISGKCSAPPAPIIPPDMNAQCKTATGKTTAYVDPTKTPDQLCSNLQCRYPDEADPNTYWMMSLNRPASDYTVCATGKNCLKGTCQSGVV